MDTSKLSPMMHQYFSLKQEHPDALLFFRLGDFYEMFFEDAKIASRELDLTLTGRDAGLEERAPMCGVPYHAVDTYINQLMEKGYKVAICEQLTDPAESKGLVERGIIRIVTPGTMTEGTFLDEKQNNNILAVFVAEGWAGLAYADVSTGEFSATQVDISENEQTLWDELIRIDPRETLLGGEARSYFEKFDVLMKACKSPPQDYETEAWNPEQATVLCKAQFPGQYADDAFAGYGNAVCAGGALLSYLHEMQMNTLPQINSVKLYGVKDNMMLDAATRTNLELTQTLRTRQRKGSLLWMLDRTRTAMGARMLRRWLEQPLHSVSQINRRLDAVEELTGNLLVRQQLSDELAGVRDIERISTKIAYDTINARDCVALLHSIQAVPYLKDILQKMKAPLLAELHSRMDPMQDVSDLLSRAIMDEPGINIKDGGIIREGYNDLLDQYRDGYRNGREKIAAMEAKERQETGIKNLRISFNRVFGYYIEVSKSNLPMVPYRYTRKQTLTTGERFITQELKDLENTVLGAEENATKLEYDLFLDIRTALSKQLQRFQQTARALAALDALLSLAVTAQENRYVKPKMTEDGQIQIIDGRHPVVESALDAGAQFVPNHTRLDSKDSRFILITGPNMAGKSTYLRQVALITIMAHMGSFVPASDATISLIDQVFTRVGASDDLYLGQSTFMVEMLELSNILRKATSNSLILLDEIGRGTSTFDGLSIAWAVVEYICNPETIGAKTLFATHYHELCTMEGQVAGVRNYCVSVTEVGKQVIFLRRIVRGASDKSFGIHVAKMAGLPEAVIQRADAVLARLEAENQNSAMMQQTAKETGETVNRPEDYKAQQLTLESMLPYADMLEEVRGTDMTTTTPIEAFYLLNRLIERMKKT